MKLIILEAALGLDVPRRLIDEERAVGDHPLRRRVVLRRDPFVEILSVKQDDRVRGSCPAGRAGSDHFGNRLPDFGVLRLGILGRSSLPEERIAKNEIRERENQQEANPHVFTMEPEMWAHVAGIL
jgi:hypothetical protein